jgi:hypothetical protein
MDYYATGSTIPNATWNATLITGANGVNIASTLINSTVMAFVYLDGSSLQLVYLNVTSMTPISILLVESNAYTSQQLTIITFNTPDMGYFPSTQYTGPLIVISWFTNAYSINAAIFDGNGNT